MSTRQIHEEVDAPRIFGGGLLAKQVHGPTNADPSGDVGDNHEFVPQLQVYRHLVDGQVCEGADNNAGPQIPVLFKPMVEPRRHRWIGRALLDEDELVSARQAHEFEQQLRLVRAVNAARGKGAKLGAVERQSEY
jgi:hypothetical protein